MVHAIHQSNFRSPFLEGAALTNCLQKIGNVLNKIKDTVIHFFQWILPCIFKNKTRGAIPPAVQMRQEPLIQQPVRPITAVAQPILPAAVIPQPPVTQHSQQAAALVHLLPQQLLPAPAPAAAAPAIQPPAAPVLLAAAPVVQPQPATAPAAAAPAIQPPAAPAPLAAAPVVQPQPVPAPTAPAPAVQPPAAPALLAAPPVVQPQPAPTPVLAPEANAESSQANIAHAAALKGGIMSEIVAPQPQFAASVSASSTAVNEDAGADPFRVAPPQPQSVTPASAAAAKDQAEVDQLLIEHERIIAARLPLSAPSAASSSAAAQRGAEVNPSLLEQGANGDTHRYQSVAAAATSPLSEAVSPPSGALSPAATASPEAGKDEALADPFLLEQDPEIVDLVALSAPSAEASSAAVISSLRANGVGSQPRRQGPLWDDVNKGTNNLSQIGASPKAGLWVVLEGIRRLMKNETIDQMFLDAVLADGVDHYSAVKDSKTDDWIQDTIAGYSFTPVRLAADRFAHAKSPTCYFSTPKDGVNPEAYANSYYKHLETMVELLQVTAKKLKTPWMGALFFKGSEDNPLVFGIVVRKLKNGWNYYFLNPNGEPGARGTPISLHTFGRPGLLGQYLKKVAPINVKDDTAGDKFWVTPFIRQN